MNGGMTGASSNIGCLEALPVQALQLAQSALKALGSFVVCSKEAVYCMGYTKACIQRCKYTLVYTKRRQQYLE